MKHIENRLENCNINDYIGGNQTSNFYISMLQDKEREFVITYNTNIRPVSYFTGREMELQELRQKIDRKCKAVLVSGMGGIGKTHICRKLFEEYYRKGKDKNGSFSYIGYVEYNGDIGSSLQKCLRYKEQKHPEANLEAAWKELEYLASRGKLLLFVDNVNVSIEKDPGLERLKKIPGAIILTSRRRTFSKEFEPYRIGFLSTEQCKELYKKIQIENDGKKVKKEELSDLEYVINELTARHTITIEFLAHLASTKSWSVKKLREKLEMNGFQLEYMDEEDKLVNIQNSFETLYDLSELTKAEKNILEAFSVFPYIPLSNEVCNWWLLSDAGVKESENILVKLYRKGWLQFDIERESYTLHPVFAQFIYTKCRPRIEEHFGLIKECKLTLKILNNASVAICQFYILFAKNIIQKIKMKEDREQVDFIIALAYLLNYIAQYKEAKEWYERSIYIGERILGKEDLYVAIAYNNLAGVYENQGEYEKAEELYETSINIFESVEGEFHLDTANSYNNLASIYMKRGEYKKAENLYEKSLQIRKKVLGEENLTTANSYNNLAGIYMRQGDYQKAEELYERSIYICKKILGEKNLETAIRYNNLGNGYERQKEYKKAEELYKKSLQIREEILGEKHSATATGYNNLGSVYEQQGKYREAEELYEKSLQIREEVLGEFHPDTIISYYNLAGVYQSQGKYKMAFTYYLKLYKIFSCKLGVEHPYAQIIYKNIEIIYSKLKNL